MPNASNGGANSAFGFNGSKGKGKGKKGKKGTGAVHGPDGELHKNPNQLFDYAAMREKREKIE